MAVKSIPDGYHAVTPYLIVDGAAEALEFYKKAFGAKEELRLDSPDGGKVGHAEILIGDSHVMLSDEHPEFDALSPTTRGGTPVTLCLYCDNADETFARAVEAGATQVRPLQNQFYGDRSGTVQDPYGHIWTISTHIEDLSQEEIEKRMAEAMQQAGSGTESPATQSPRKNTA